MTYHAPPPRKTIRINPALDRGCALPGVFLSRDLQPDALPDSVAVRIPRGPDARRKFLKAWARKNSRRIAQGLGVISLIVPMAGMAAAQEGPVAAESIAGVVDVALQDDGSAIITLADGRQLVIGRDNISVGDDRAILLSGPAAEAVMVAAAEISAADGGDSFAALGAGAGGLALLAAAAGGGGGGSGGTTPDPVELGFAVDGYLSGATVYGDANGNLVLDAGEIQTVTGSDGSFNTAIFPDDVPLVTIGGIDISTGETFTGTLTAPAGSTNITPLTTLVQKLVADTAGTDTPLSVADATASVASSLGLEGDAAELLTVDPAALAESGDTTQLQAAAKVAVVINLVTAAASGDQAAVDSVLSALTADLTDGGEDPFTSPTAIEAALTAAGDGIQVNATDLANVIADVTTEIDATEDLATLEQVQTAVQGELTEAVTTSVGDTSATSPLATTVVTETIATTVGLRPVITGSTSLSDPVAEGTAITISGTGRAGSTVVVELGEATRAVAVDGSGDWSVEFTGANYLAAGEDEGTVTVVATATADGVTSSAALGAPSYQIDALPPVAPAFDIADATIDVAGIAAVEISGTAEPDTTVRLESTLFAAPIEVSVDAEGVWTTGALDLSAAGDDSYTITATSTDAAGNTSPTATADRVVDASAPAVPTIDVVAGDNFVGLADVTNDTYTITGTTEAGTSVEVSVDGTVGQADVSGTTWSYDIAVTPETEFSQNTIFAVAADSAGNASPASATVQVNVDLDIPPQPSFDALDGTIDASGIGSVVISGSGEPNTTVTLESTLFDAPIEVSVGLDSKWTTGALDLTEATDATYTITATSVDLAGNTSPSATAERVVDVVPNDAPVIRIFDIPAGFEYSAGELVVYDGEELSMITTDDGVNESLRGTITNTPVGTEITLTVQDAAGNNLIGPYTATTALDENDEVGFVLEIPDVDVLGLDPMTQSATVTISGGGGEFLLKSIVNSGLGDPASGQFLAGGAVIEPFTDIGVFGAEGSTTRTILEGQEMTNGQTVIIAEIIDTADTDSEQYPAILVYDGESSAPIRSFAFDGGAGADLTARSTKIDARADGIVLTQINVVTDGNGNPAQGDPLFTVYNIPAASVAAAIPDGSGTEVNINTAAAGVTSTPITLADFGGDLPAGEAYQLDFLPDAPGNPVFIAVREPIEGGTGPTDVVFGTIDMANGEVTTRTIAATDVAPFDGYDRAAVLDLIQTDIDGNYVSLTLAAPDLGDGFTRTQTFDFATEKFTGGTLGIDDNRDLMVATEFREVLDGGDETTGTDDDVIIVGNQTADEGIVQLNVTGGAATLAISTQALLSFFDGVPDDGTESILVQFDLFVAGSAAPDLGTLTGGTYTGADPAGALSAYSTGIETTRITLDIDLQGVRALATPPETLDLASVDVSGADGSTFYGLGVGFVEGEGVDPVFDGFELVGGVEDFGRKTVVLENSQGRGGFDIVSGFDTSNADASKQDLLVIEADFGTFRGDGIATVGETPVTLGSDMGIVIFEGVTEDSDAGVVGRADAANLGLVADEEIIALTANEDEAALWKLTFDGTTYQADSFGRLTGVTADDLPSFTDDGFTNIALQSPLPTV